MNVRGRVKGANSLKGLGAFKLGREIRLLYLRGNREVSLFQSISADGEKFRGNNNLVVRDRRGRRANLSDLSAIRVSTFANKLISIYKFDKGLAATVYLGVSSKREIFNLDSRIFQISETAAVVPDFKYQGKFVAYCGGTSLRILKSSDLKNWYITKKPVLTLNENAKIEIGTVEKIHQGILVIYFEAIAFKANKYFYSINAAIFDDQNPEKLILKSKQPIWEEPSEWNSLKINVRPFGIVTVGDRLISYWQLESDEIVSIVHEKRVIVHKEAKDIPRINLRKHQQNPILKPIRENFWESKATFNPAAIYDEGAVHIVYRAIGDQDMSMLGYAQSRDGVHIDYRHKEPIFVPTRPFEFKKRSQGEPIPLSAYASGGGGYGGAEDPRMTKIGNKIYMTYVAYDGAGPPRVALTSIALADFRRKKWKWTIPVVISKPNVVDKNAVIFPEQIAGKYCILHRIYPDILVDFVDSLEFDGRTYLPGEYKISPRRLYWDNRKIGAGAPPLKTKFGWLLIYHAVGEEDSGRYKIGAMLLDLKDPTKVLARTDSPILEPCEHYENEGLKFGVVYPCGSVIMDNQLLVYYGGADMVSCVARADLEQFLHSLQYHHVGKLKPMQI